jgi:hypothetical protein
MSRYLKLLAGAFAIGLVLMFVARSLHAPALIAAKTPEIPSVALALTLTRDGITPANASVPKDHHVMLTITNHRHDRVGLSLHGYQDRLLIGWIEPDSTWRGEFLADRPGDGFAWMLEGEPVGKLAVEGSHLEDGHR